MTVEEAKEALGKLKLSIQGDAYAAAMEDLELRGGGGGTFTFDVAGGG